MSACLLGCPERRRAHELVAVRPREECGVQCPHHQGTYTLLFVCLDRWHRPFGSSNKTASWRNWVGSCGSCFFRTPERKCTQTFLGFVRLAERHLRSCSRSPCSPPWQACLTNMLGLAKLCRSIEISRPNHCLYVCCCCLVCLCIAWRCALDSLQREATGDRCGRLDGRLGGGRFVSCGGVQTDPCGGGGARL